MAKINEDKKKVHVKSHTKEVNGKKMKVPEHCRSTTMITEEKLLEKWRNLETIKQDKVIEFIDSLEKSSADDCPYQPLWDSLELFSDDFLETREQLPLEIREVFFE